jgi:hypothetical protein
VPFLKESVGYWFDIAQNSSSFFHLTFSLSILGVASGSYICGRLIDAYGGVVALRTYSVGALLWLSIFWLMEVLMRKMKVYPLHQGHNRE